MIEIPGKVIIADGTIEITAFQFNKVNLDEARREVLKWALEQLKERCWEAGLRNL